MNDVYLNPIEVYMRHAFKIIVLLVPLAAFCASLTFTILKLLGLYPMVPVAELVCFDVMDVLFILIGIHIARRCTTDIGELKNSYLKGGKIYIALVIMIQWNFISYLIPSADFWAYLPFFTLFAVTFLDHQYVAAISGGLLVSTALSWIITGDTLLPMQDARYTPNMVLRGVLLVLVEAFLWFLTYLIQTVLIRDIEGIAAHDPLTHLRNRRTLYKCLDDMKADGEPFSVLMCDLDDFKKVNDTYGHECGDAVLESFADTVRRSVGENDIIFRYGGEEILILVNGDSSAANKTAERVRRAVMEGAVTCGETSVSGTITVGTAEYVPGQSDDDLIKLADHRMYIGKQQGKNRVISEG